MQGEFYMQQTAQHFKMKKLYIILIGIFILGIVGAISFSLTDSYFKTKITKISAEKLCNKISLSAVQNTLCKQIEKTNYEVDSSQISIKYNDKTKVYQVKAQ